MPQGYLLTFSVRLALTPTAQVCLLAASVRQAAIPMPQVYLLAINTRQASTPTSQVHLLAATASQCQIGLYSNTTGLSTCSKCHCVRLASTPIQGFKLLPVTRQQHQFRRQQLPVPSCWTAANVYMGMNNFFCPFLERFCHFSKFWPSWGPFCQDSSSFCPLSTSGKEKGCFGAGFWGVLCTYISPKGVCSLSKEQGLLVVFWAK